MDLLETSTVFCTRWSELVSASHRVIHRSTRQLTHLEDDFLECLSDTFTLISMFMSSMLGAVSLERAYPASSLLLKAFKEVWACCTCGMYSFPCVSRCRVLADMCRLCVDGDPLRESPLPRFAKGNDIHWPFVSTLLV